MVASWRATEEAKLESSFGSKAISAFPPAAVLNCQVREATQRFAKELVASSPISFLPTTELGAAMTILLCDAKYLGPDGIPILSLTLHGTLGRSGP
jgi:hypothetical protein